MDEFVGITKGAEATVEFGYDSRARLTSKRTGYVEELWKTDAIGDYFEADLQGPVRAYGAGGRILKRGDTEYGVKAIPAGAYVKIIGMSNLDEVDPADEERTYRAKSTWRRLSCCQG